MSTARPVFSLAFAAALLAGAGSELFGVCGPFTDTAGDAFCPFVLEVFYTGITTGTTATTYDPAGNVSRLQMAAFLSRTVDGVLKRGSRHAALRRFWTPKGFAGLGVTTIGADPRGIESDGVDVWAAAGNTVPRIRGSDGKLLETWTGASSARRVLSAVGRIFVTGGTSPGSLYRIDPTQPAGAVTTLASNLGVAPNGIAWDGEKVWTANEGPAGSVSIVTPKSTIPWTVTTVTAGFDSPVGALYDGANVWVTDRSADTRLKLDSAGAILQTITVGSGPVHPVFDGTSIWVPSGFSVSVVRASTGALLATLTGNGQSLPESAAFDGERILVTSIAGDQVSLWKAADLTPIGAFGLGPTTLPSGACSDGIQFWIALYGRGMVARF